VEIMTGRERFKMALSHQEADSIPIQDSIWPATVWRWHKEGLPDADSPQDYFNFDMASLAQIYQQDFLLKLWKKMMNI